MADKTLLEQLRSQIKTAESRAPSSKGPRKAGPGAKRSGSKERDLSSPDDALSKIVSLVNVSDRSEDALRRRLAEDGFSPDAIDEAVDCAKSYGIIDDMRFAEVLIRSRLSQGKGVMGIERELRNQGIDVFEVPGWPEEFEISEDAEFDRALALLESRPPRSKNPREGAYRKLVSKGYSSSTASSAARAWFERAHS